MQIASSTPAVAVVPHIGIRLQALLALALGLAIVAMIGFSHVDVIHNAAHDLRHSNGFPCH